MGGDRREVESLETDGGPAAIGARELVVNSAVGSHISVGKEGQSLINELYPCFSNIKLRAKMCKSRTPSVS